jgi:large subunit ribosomal protein L22
MSEETKNIALAKAKSLKTSIQKVNLVLKSIRGKKAENALNILAFSNKRISNEIIKVLKSAIANAENNHQLDIDKLFVKEATAGKSMTLKRFRPRARGRSGKILKPYSKIKILVQEASELKKTDEKKTNEKQIDKSKKNIVLTDKNQINQVKKTEEKQANQTANNLTEDNKDGTKN